MSSNYKKRVVLTINSPNTALRHAFLSEKNQWCERKLEYQAVAVDASAIGRELHQTPDNFLVSHLIPFASHFAKIFKSQGVSYKSSNQWKYWDEYDWLKNLGFLDLFCSPYLQNWESVTLNWISSLSQSLVWERLQLWLMYNYWLIAVRKH